MADAPNADFEGLPVRRETEVSKLRLAVQASADALRRAGRPGFPGYQAACSIVANDLDRALDEAKK